MTTRAELPAGVSRGSFGPVLVSMVGLLTIRFRQSKRLAQELVSALVNVELSLGATSKIEQQTSEVLARLPGLRGPRRQGRRAHHARLDGRPAPSLLPA